MHRIATLLPNIAVTEELFSVSPVYSLLASIANTCPGTIKMDEQPLLDETKIKSAIADLSDMPDSPALPKSSPYQGLDRLSVLIASLGTLRIVFQSTAGINASLDQHDCESLAAFITLLEEDFDNVLEGLYRENPK